MSRAIYPSLKGKSVVVTGGGSGIGGALTEGFVAQGARVTFLDIADEESKALEARLSDAAIAPTYRRCNLKDLAEIERVFAEIGDVDVLVNNAANDDRHGLEDITPEYWDDRIAVNLRHLAFCAKAVVPGMKAKGAGAIINLGSVSWHLAIEKLVIYQTAKAGIEGLTRALARDLGADGIRVTCVVPGGVQTPRQMKLWHNPEVEAAMIAQQCLKARVMPEDIAAMVLFLASDDARMCTAHEYFVDAGWR
jgi:NAD(P)-dependent dehydrogenase (short-subunit alcohol dehydrogenase family)